MNCKICNAETTKIFEKNVLLKYNVSYFQCTACDFVQTEEPYWLEEAYNSAITSLDIGLLYRNTYLVKEIKRIIEACFPSSKIMLDFAGGYGNFVRQMRDIGFNFFRQDDYCENLFAKHFDIKDIDENKFDLVTAFEVLEHLSNPLAEIERIFNYSDHVIFSTELIPNTVDEIKNWIYISEETGQHISFYSPKSLALIAKKFNKNYYCKLGHIHIFTPIQFSKEQINYALLNKEYEYKIFGIKVNKYKKFRLNYPSLMPQDRAHIVKKLNIK